MLRDHDTMSSLSISSAESRRFADFSKDRNPIHIDAQAARLSHFGQPIVHGLHTVLAALEAHLAASDAATAGQLQHLSVQLPQPVYAGDHLTVRAEGGPHGKWQLRVQTAGTTVAILRLVTSGKDLGAAGSDQFVSTAGEFADEAKCRRIDEAGPIEGRMSLACDMDPTTLFPRTCAWLGRRSVVGLARVSTIIGMEWPGLYSVLSEFSVQFESAGRGFADLTFKVDNTDDRFGLTSVAVSGPDFTGHIGAFFRPEPPEQPSYAALKAAVTESEFAGHRSVVIGGSRGLGEISAKLLAAGGGLPIVTFRHDALRARNIASEIRQGGGDCMVEPLDVTSTDQVAELFASIEPVNSLLYYATPKIFRRRGPRFSYPLCQEFLSYYVEHFTNCIEAAIERTPHRITAFYPSTIALDTPLEALAEYSVAKAAGEAACANMALRTKHLRVIIERLPRMLTEQTNSIMRSAAADPVTVLLPIIRAIVNS